MLTLLRIRNLALVDDLTLELKPGFNAITGETGAGKSILIGALNLTLGGRADRTLIRSGSDQCGVEAVFQINGRLAGVEDVLAENGLDPCEENQLIIRRTFTRAGTNRQFVNGCPATLTALAALGEWLVDIHGPHDHQSLLRPASQLEILDAYGNLLPLRQQFGDLLGSRQMLKQQKAELIVDEQTYAQQLDLLRFQVHEITGAGLNGEDEEQLEAEYHRASNAARLLELIAQAAALIDSESPSVLGPLGTLGRCLREVHRHDSQAAPMVELQEQAVALLSELQAELTHYADHVEIDPGRLEELETRINQLQMLKRKYGSSVGEILAFGVAAAGKLRQLEERDAELQRLDAELARLDEALWATGTELSMKRMKVIPRISKAVGMELGDLGFADSRFEIAPTTLSREEGTAAQMTSSGLDRVEYLFAPNPGEPAKPLRSIASSGEMARVMLAVKTVLAAEDKVPVLVFDEIDANVGGETAAVVGEKMRRIGEKHQAICITHLAPVAAAADSHLVVLKIVKSGKTLTEIQSLDGKARIEELARMLGGKGVAQMRHARALIRKKS